MNAGSRKAKTNGKRDYGDTEGTEEGNGRGEPQMLARAGEHLRFPWPFSCA